MVANKKSKISRMPAPKTGNVVPVFLIQAQAAMAALGKAKIWLKRQYEKKPVRLALAYSATAAAFLLVFLFTHKAPNIQALAGQPTAPAATPMVLGAMDDTLRGGEASGPAGQPFAVGMASTTAASSRNFLVYDEATGTDLLQKNASEKVSIGSITKLVTALVAYDQLNLNSFATITPDDRLSVSPSLGLKAGDSVRITDLLNAMLVGSENDAAYALAHITERETGKDFTALMNAKARQLGMKNSRFSNPMGFDSPYNYSTAEDIKLLVGETRKYSLFTSLGRQDSYYFTSQYGAGYNAVATNRLIKTHSDIEAIKTGTTQNAHEAMVTSAAKDGHTVIIIVLMSDNREGDTLLLKDETFGNFEWK